MRPLPPRGCATVASLRGGQTMGDREAPRGLHKRTKTQERRLAELESAMVTLQSAYAGASRPGGDAEGAGLAGGLAQTQGEYDDALLVLRDLQAMARRLRDWGLSTVGHGVVGERLPQTRFAFSQRIARHPALPRASPPRAASPLRLPAVLCYRQRQLPRVSTCASRNKRRHILAYKASLLPSCESV